MKLRGVVLKKVLLINEGYSDNLGDQAIKYSIQKMLERKNVQVNFQDFTRLKQEEFDYQDTVSSEKYRDMNMKKRKNFFLKMKFFLSMVKWTINSVKRSILEIKGGNYDLIIIGGGQLILSNKKFPLSMFIWVITAKIFSRAKIKLFGVGAGSDFSFFEKLLYRYSFKFMDEVYLRDAASIEYIQKNFKITSKYVPDPVFAISNFHELKMKKSKRVLIGIVDFKVFKRYNNNQISEEKYIEYWEDRVKEFQNDGYDVKLFFTTIADRQQTIKFQQKIKEETGIDLEILISANLFELLDSISTSSVIISARMHALIIGYSYNLTVIPYVISDKIKSFKSEYLETTTTKEELSNLIFKSIDEVLDEHYEENSHLYSSKVYKL